MDKQKIKAIGCIALTLVIGFAGGMASKSLFESIDKPNTARATEVATNVPVHKMQTNNFAPDQLIAPSLRSVFLDPFFMPANLDIVPLALPDFVSMPIDVPAVKTVNGDHEIQIVAKVPGLTEKDVDVQVGADIVTIKGEKKEEKKDNRSFSTVSESFVRTVQLPCKVDGDKVKATLKDGTLTVSLPKRGDKSDNKL